MFHWRQRSALVVVFYWSKHCSKIKVLKNFEYILDRPSFVRVYKFPLYKPHLFKQQIKVPLPPES